MVEKINVNLLPAEYRVHSVKIKFHKEIVWPAIISAVVIFVLILWIGTLNANIAKYTKKIAVVDADIKKNQHILDEINSLKKQKKIVLTKIKALERIDVNREKWLRLMETFSQKLPQGSWIEKLEENADTVFVEGKTYSFSEVAQYMLRLKESVFINNVDLKNIEQINISSRIYKFTIRCYINPDAKLTDHSTKVAKGN